MDAAETEETIDAVRERRASLRRAMGELELALAEPAPGRLDDWRADVSARLAALADVFDDHVRDTEAPGGFLDDIIEQAPRLANTAKRLEAEHPRIQELITGARAHLDEKPATDDDEWLDLGRELANDLLAMLLRHRQRGADIVYEAFDVDLGGG